LTSNFENRKINNRGPNNKEKPTLDDQNSKHLHNSYCLVKKGERKQVDYVNNSKGNPDTTVSN
jgi:hypothetical protein